MGNRVTWHYDGGAVSAKLLMRCFRSSSVFCGGEELLLSQSFCYSTLQNFYKNTWGTKKHLVSLLILSFSNLWVNVRVRKTQRNVVTGSTFFLSLNLLGEVWLASVTVAFGCLKHLILWISARPGNDMRRQLKNTFLITSCTWRIMCFKCYNLIYCSIESDHVELELV